MFNNLAPARGWVLGFLLAVCSPLLGQSKPVASVEILNTTNESGPTVTEVVIPVRRGWIRSAPSLRTDAGKICHVRPTGSRWADGSLRYLHVDMPLVVTPRQRRKVDLFLHTGPKPVFRPHAAVVAAKIRTWFRVAGQRVEFVSPQLVEDGPRVRVYRSGVRIKNSCIWAQMHVLVMHDCPNPRFYLEWGNSNPRSKELHEDPGTVSFEMQGARALFDERDSKLHSQYDLAGNITGSVLHVGGYLADGQAQCLEGRIVLSGGAPRVRALAHGWSASGAFGPFGELLPEFTIDPKWWQNRIAKDERQAKQPWAAPVHGCHPNPSNAGGQRDFGTIAMRPDVLTVDPARLRAIARSIFQEWCRPTHFREFDLSPVTVANHPKLITLTGRPHFPAGKGIDLLGKPGEYLDSRKIAADELGRTYRGHDGQHLSINYLCAFALITGDRLARLECEHKTEMWLSEFTHGTGMPNDRPGAARTVGRSLLAGCWLWLVTGRNDLAIRISQRTKSLVPFLLAPRSGHSKLLPYVLIPRHTKERGDYWPPWEEAIAATGLAGVHTLFGLQEARALAEVVSSNIVRHAMGITPRGWRVGYKLPFATPAGKPYYALGDPDFAAKQTAGSGLTRWTAPALVLTARYATDKDHRSHALRILIDLAQDKNFISDPDLLSWIPVVPRHLE